MSDPSNKVMDLQIWLNKHGADLKTDGIGGPATRQAIFDVFRNTKAPAATEEDKARIATRLGGSLKQMNAVSAVEAPRGGWDRKGMLTCLYERHYGWKRWRIKIPFLSNPKPGGYTIDADRDGINDSWEKAADAACRFGAEAFECLSWGKFQIMGAWWKKLGYASVLDFVFILSEHEANHYEALARYIERFGLKKAFQNISDKPSDCVAFARGYNGPGYAKYNYDRRIAAEMSKW